MIQALRFTADDRPVLGALALPPGDAPAGAVILVHEWYGLNDDMRRLAARFAAEGFIALAVDLYDGRVATDAPEAMQLSSALKTPDAVRIIAAAAEALRALPRSNGRVAVDVGEEVVALVVDHDERREVLRPRCARRPPCRARGTRAPRPS
jgi:dienelactone hydrolase